MQFKEKEIIVTEGVLPLWSKVLGAICFCLMAFFIIKLLPLQSYRADDNLGEKYLLAACLALNFALILVMVINIKFDLVKKRYKRQYTFGFVKLGLWRQLPNIEYVSVFKQMYYNEENDDTSHQYNVNLWYNGTKHFTVYTHPIAEACMNIGKSVAIKLDVDLLDATVANDYRWVTLKQEQE